MIGFIIEVKIFLWLIFFLLITLVSNSNKFYRYIIFEMSIYIVKSSYLLNHERLIRLYMDNSKVFKNEITWKTLYNYSKQ